MAFSISYIYELLDKYSLPIAKITAKQKEFNSTLESTRIKLRFIKSGLSGMDKAMGKVSKGVSAVSPMAHVPAVVSSTKKMNKVLGTTQSKAKGVSSELSTMQNAVNKTVKPVKKLTSKTKVLNDRLGATHKRLKNVSSGLLSTQTALSTVAIGAAGIFPTKLAINFESQMADVSKAMDGLTPKQFDDLKLSIMKASEEMGTSSVQIAKIAEAGGKMKVPIDKMGEFMRIVSRTSIAFDVMEDVAGDAIGGLRNRIGLTINETDRFMDAINFLADNTSAKGDRMVQIIGRVAGTISKIKMPANFIAGWAAFADQVAVTPELAASGLRMFINKLTNIPGMMSKFLIDPHKTLVAVLEEIQRIDPKIRSIEVERVFGREAGRFAELASGKLSLLKETMALVGDETKYTGSMMKELNKKLNTAEFRIKRVVVKFKNLGIIIGESVLPVIETLTPLVLKAGDSFKSFAKAHPLLMKIGIIGAIATAAMGSLLIAAGAVAGAIAFLIPVFTTIGPIIAGFFAAAISFPALIAIAFTTLAAAIKMDVFKTAFDFWIEKANTIWDTFKKIAGTIKDVSKIIGTGLFESFGKIKEGLFGQLGKNKDESVTADKANTFKSMLNGKIEVVGSGGVSVKRAEMATDMPGNLGFNMAGAM